MVFSVHKCIMQTFTTSTKWKALVTHSCLTLCDPMDCSPPGFSVHEICQARILEWVAISSFRGSSRPRDQTQVSGIAGEFFTVWATREALLQNWFDTIHLVFFYCSFYSVPWTSLPWTWVKTPYWNTEHCSWIKWLLVRTVTPKAKYQLEDKAHSLASACQGKQCQWYSHQRNQNQMPRH